MSGQLNVYNVVALDFESTGLLKQDTQDPHQQPGIVQIGAVKFANPGSFRPGAAFDESVAQTYGQLIDPECHFEEEAQKVTGLTPEDLYGKPTFSEAIGDFAEFMFDCKWLVTFNGAGFDIPLLQYNLRKAGLETRFPWPLIHYDIMKISTTHLGLQGKQGNKWPNLQELHTGLFGEGFEGAHDAVVDAQHTLNCAAAMRQKGWM